MRRPEERNLFHECLSSGNTSVLWGKVFAINGIVVIVYNTDSVAEWLSGWTQLTTMKPREQEARTNGPGRGKKYAY
jgi:hypothetical protein